MYDRNYRNKLHCKHHYATEVVSQLAFANCCSVQFLANQRCRQWSNTLLTFCHIQHLKYKRKRRRTSKKYSKKKKTNGFRKHFQGVQPVTTIGDRRPVFEHCSHCNVIFNIGELKEELFKRRKKVFSGMQIMNIFWFLTWHLIPNIFVNLSYAVWKHMPWETISVNNLLISLRCFMRINHISM